MIDEAQKIARKLYGNRIRIRVGGICRENGQVLMICHKGVIDDNDVWLPPGGGIEEGETISEALVREFLEETGLHIEVGRLLFKREFIHPPLHSIELYFSVTIQSGELIKGTDPEVKGDAQIIKDVRWVPVQNREFFTDDVYLAINS